MTRESVTVSAAHGSDLERAAIEKVNYGLK